MAQGALHQRGLGPARLRLRRRRIGRQFSKNPLRKLARLALIARRADRRFQARPIGRQRLQLRQILRLPRRIRKEAVRQIPRRQLPPRQPRLQHRPRFRQRRCHRSLGPRTRHQGQPLALALRGLHLGLHALQGAKRFALHWAQHIGPAVNSRHPAAPQHRQAAHQQDPRTPARQATAPRRNLAHRHRRRRYLNLQPHRQRQKTKQHDRRPNQDPQRRQGTQLRNPRQRTQRQRTKHQGRRQRRPNHPRQHPPTHPRPRRPRHGLRLVQRHHPKILNHPRQNRRKPHRHHIQPPINQPRRPQGQQVRDQDGHHQQNQRLQRPVQQPKQKGHDQGDPPHRLRHILLHARGNLRAKRRFPRKGEDHRRKLRMPRPPNRNPFLPHAHQPLRH